MGKFIIGIDIGGSTTKIVGLQDGKLVNPFMAKASDPLTSAYGAFGKYLNDNGLAISDVEKVIITGVGSGFFKDGLYGIPTVKEDEFRCVGLGGRFISGLDDLVVVSMGTGTAIVSVENGEPEYIGGTGVGGGTILGLSAKMIGVRDFDTIIRLADKGDLSKVDLLIGDISPDSVGNMNAAVTASNFGKVSDEATQADLARGLLNLVVQTIGLSAIFCGRAKGLKTIVLTGNLSRAAFRDTLDMMENLYNVKFLVPEDSEFAAAIGAAICGALQ